MSKKIAPVSVRLTIEQRAIVSRLAAAEGISMSEVLRRGALGPTEMVGNEGPDKPKPVGSNKRKRRH